MVEHRVPASACVEHLVGPFPVAAEHGEMQVPAVPRDGGKALDPPELQVALDAVPIDHEQVDIGFGEERHDHALPVHHRGRPSRGVGRGRAARGALGRPDVGGRLLLVGTDEGGDAGRQHGEREHGADDGRSRPPPPEPGETSWQGAGAGPPGAR
jgi:hypothetical protein